MKFAQSTCAGPATVQDWFSKENSRSSRRNGERVWNEKHIVAGYEIFGSEQFLCRILIAMTKSFICAYNAVKSGKGNISNRNFEKKGKVCEWTFERLQEACNKVAMGDIGRVSISQEICPKEH